MRYLLPFVLTGCAAAIQVGPAGPDPDPVVIGEGATPNSEIVIYRADQIGFVTNVAARPTLALNGRDVGRCAFGKPVRVRISPGDYTVSATGNGAVDQSVSLQEFGTIYLRCGTSGSPALSPAPTLEPVSAATAAREASL